jgi:hypothetical protein
VARVKTALPPLGTGGRKVARALRRPSRRRLERQLWVMNVDFDPSKLCPLYPRLCCKTPLLFSAGPICVLLSLWRSPLRASYGIIGLHAWHRVTAADGGGRQRNLNLTRRRRFWAVAVSNTSSLAPLRPRSRSRSSLKIRFMSAKRISTFLRSRRDCSKASVLASARATQHLNLPKGKAAAHHRNSHRWSYASLSRLERDRSNTKSARLKVPSERADLSQTGMCGAI